MEWLKPSNKINLIWLLVAAPTISLNAHAQCCNFNGFNVGAGLGVINAGSAISSTVTEDGLTASAQAQVYRLGPMGNIFAGYSITPNNWFYLGAEAGLNISSRTDNVLQSNASYGGVVTGTDTVYGISTGYVSLNNNLSTTTTVTRRSWEPTLDLKPGLLLTPNLVAYARLGLGFNKLTLTSRSNYSGYASQFVTIPGYFFTSSSTAATIQLFHQSHGRNVVGWRLGAGLTGLLSHNIGVSADYIYTFYNSGYATRTSSSNQVSCDIIEGCTVNPDGRYQATSRARPNNQQILMSLIYYLC